MSVELAWQKIRVRLSGLTVEQALYISIVLIATIFRLLSLGNIPLSPGESEEALAVWRLWSAQNDDLTILSPGYFSLTAAITFLFGFSDEIVRIIPALFGVGVVILPWFLRAHLTRRGMLVAGLLLALSPTQNLVSRTVGGNSIAVFSGFFVFVAWLRLDNDHKERWLALLGLGLALLLTSSPGGYTVIVSFALAWLAHRKLGPQFAIDEFNNPPWTLAINGPQLRSIFKVSFPAFLMLGTSFLLRPDGLGASADMPVKWLAQIELGRNEITVFHPLLIIARYELALLILAIPALMWSIWESRPLPSLLAYWLIVTLLISLLQPGYQVNVVLLTIPTYLLVGHFLGQSFNEETGHYKWFLAGILLIVALVAYVNIIRFLRLSLFSVLPLFSYNILLVTLAGLAAAIVLSLIWNWHVSLAKQGMLLTMLLLVAFYHWGTAWWMTRHGGNDTRERWVTMASDGEIVDLAKVVSETSIQITGSSTDLEVVSTVRNPALEWYLREMSNVQYFRQLPMSIRSQAIISPNTEFPLLEDSYIGADFGHIRTWSEGLLAPRQALSWWLFHYATRKIEEERIIFWVRGDLSGAPS